jgi:hypothetical protein
MSGEILRTLGSIAGIGGIALGVMLLVFRDIIRKKVFAQLTRAQSYDLLRLVTVLTWSVAVLGIAAWAWGGSVGGVVANDGVAAGGDLNARDIIIEGSGGRAD